MHLPRVGQEDRLERKGHGAPGTQSGSHIRAGGRPHHRWLEHSPSQSKEVHAPHDPAVPLWDTFPKMAPSEGAHIAPLVARETRTHSECPLLGRYTGSVNGKPWTRTQQGEQWSPHLQAQSPEAQQCGAHAFGKFPVPAPGMGQQKDSFPWTLTMRMGAG